MIYTNEFVLVMDETLLEASFFDEIDKWRAANQDSACKEYKNNMVSDEDYEKLQNAINLIETAEDYKEYKKAFDRICYFCHVVSRGVIFVKYELKKGKPDKNSFYLKYNYNTKRMTLPEGSQLYHMSKVGGITELMPFFRGKAERGYKYDKPRIYLTIRKSMPKLMADYKATEKMHMYLVKEPVRQVFVDPLLWGYVSGAVYVETNKPIKVEEITDKDKAAEIKEKNDDAFKEEVLLEEAEGEIPFDVDHFLNFVNENGLLLFEQVGELSMNNIFENVQFIGDEQVSLNEFAGFGELIAMLGAMIIVGGIGVLIEPLSSKERRKANNALIMYTSKHKTVYDFNKKAFKVGGISPVDLFNKIGNDKHDAKLARYAGGITCYAIFDNKNNIMAYALFSNNLKDGYAYKICDKSFKNTPELNVFVKATFELAAGFYGPGLKKVLKFNPKSFNKDTDVDTKDSNTIYRNEYLEVLNTMQTLFDKLVSEMKKLVESKYQESYPEGVQFTDKDINFWKKSCNSMKKIHPNLTAYIQYDYNDAKFDEDSIDIIMNKMENIIETFGFHVEEHDYYIGISTKENDKYPHIRIQLYDVGDDNAVYLEIESIKPLIVK